MFVVTTFCELIAEGSVSVNSHDNWSHTDMVDKRKVTRGEEVCHFLENLIKHDVR